MAFILDTFPSDFQTARDYSTRVYALLNGSVRTLPQGEAASMQVRAGLVMEAKVDAKWNTRYTVRKDGKTYRGISALITSLETAWEADKLDQQLTAEIARRAEAKAVAANLASFEGVSDETIAELADRPETLRVVAGVARLFNGWTITKVGAIEAMQAAGVALTSAQAEADHLEAARPAAEVLQEWEPVAKPAPTPEMQAFAAAWSSATPAQMGEAQRAAEERQKAKDDAQRPALMTYAELVEVPMSDWVYDDAQGGYVKRCDWHEPLRLAAGTPGESPELAQAREAVYEVQPPEPAFAEPAPQTVTLTLSRDDMVMLRRIVRESRDAHAADCTEAPTEGARAVALMYHDDAVRLLGEVRQAIRTSDAARHV